MCRRLGLALFVGVLLVAVPASADDDSGSDSPFGFLRSGIDSIRREAAHGLSTFVDKTAKVADKIVRFAVVRSTEDEICYRILGCFSLKSPWVSLRRPLPAPRNPEHINVRFFLYTRASSERYNITSGGPLTLEDSQFDGRKRTFFLVHGFLNSGNKTWLADLKDAILGKVNGNVFIVDWGDGAMEPNYLQATSNTRIVGREIAWLALNLIEHYRASARRMHFFGHSLGSHISAYAARSITKVNRITALDPAGPAFEGLPRLVRLSKADADFVDVLHTNAKPVTTLGFGMMHPIGHVDFYLNGGVEQPGCLVPDVESPKSILDLITFPVNAVGELVSCSHSRSYIYITEAIKNTGCRMWGHKVSVSRQRLSWRHNIPSEVPASTRGCERGRCIPIGLDTPQYPARGVFHVTTAADSPYCLQERSSDGQTLEVLRQLGYLA